MYTGTVLTFSAPKGYGFVSNNAGGPDVFVHFSALLMDGYKSLDVGDVVQYDIETGPKGKPQAAQVTVLRKAGR